MKIIQPKDETLLTENPESVQSGYIMVKKAKAKKPVKAAKKK